MSILSQKHFHDEEAAYEYVEARIWPTGAVCPRCGEQERVGKLKGKSTRIGVHKCYSCRKPFTVKIGTIFESSHVKMHLWMQAIYLMSSSKKGISTQQLHRTLGVTLKTAWFMSHRIREAMRDGVMAPLGGSGSQVEADETYFGNKAGKQELPASRNGRPYIKKGKAGQKRAIVSLVERGGPVRSFHVKQANKENVSSILLNNLDLESRLNTDESPLYKSVGQDFLSHGTTKHSAGEYVRGDIHSNTVENYFSTFKRGMKGTYQHCAEKHLHRYLAEFDFRYNNRVGLGVNDTDRTLNLLSGVVGKRLTYQTAQTG
ncbi:DDE transposase [Algimonas arctica]|uniref:DDE transposase n=1 Tax=Algimonas arctica TaxID=1479486 RepID=A0A8J3G330_9PROT|nr:IS1595 family transposase [Algimonas arctica]GHA99114.1 DDE transposase [Algimonas arctica]